MLCVPENEAGKRDQQFPSALYLLHIVGVGVVDDMFTDPVHGLDVECATLRWNGFSRLGGGVNIFPWHVAESLEGGKG